jgi:hypothetical protein
VNQVPRDPMDFVVGDRVPGTKWVMRGKLGEGGMGVVLDVVKEPGIQGAMKVMLPGFAKRREFVSRFFDEVRLLAQLRHPNIVQVFDFDQLDDGTPYVVMERLLGVTLRAGLRNFRQKGTPISAKLIYEITRQLCEGLFRAHSNTPVIVHRDVKPENIFFHQPDFADTVVKVIDFGIAAVLDGTRDRRVFGTPRHMAPEQIGGHTVSPATDVYAVALVLYELLTGRFPWDIDLRNELALVEAHLHRPPVPPSRYTPWVPPLVDQWILRALSKDPKHRPQDAYQFIAKLYQLQFVNDGTSGPVVDLHTTAPALVRLAEAVGAGAEPGDAGEMSRGVTPAPVEDLAPQTAPPGPARAEPDPEEIDVLPMSSWPEDEPSPPMTETSMAVASAVHSLVGAASAASAAGAAGAAGAVRGHAAARGRDAIVPAAVGATLVVGLFVGIVYLNGPKSTPAVAAGQEPERPSPAMWDPVLYPPSRQGMAPVKIAAAPPRTPSMPPLGAPEATLAAPAGSLQAAALAVRPATHAATGPSGSAHSVHDPDDGRDLLYVHP